jgi:penicillin-binding protein 1A
LPEAADDARWREILADYQDPVNLETALVLQADETSATVYLRNRGRRSIDLAAVEWAAPHINDNIVGARPNAVSDVLNAGDIVRFRTLEDGSLRLGQLPEVQGAFVSLDPQDGAIVSLVGGFDFFLNNFNRATQSKRQPGSSFKPFVYSAALENGFTTASVINDAPFTQYSADLEAVWKPENYGGRWHGPTRLREALVESINSVAVRVLLEAGVGNTIGHMRKFGFKDDALPRDATLALGTGGVPPKDLIAGYAVLANGGFSVAPYFIQRVEDANGEVLYEAKPDFVCPDCEMTAAAAEAPQEDVPADGLVADAAELFRISRAPSASCRPRMFSWSRI